MRRPAHLHSFGRRLAMLGLLLAGLMAGGTRGVCAQPPAAALYGSEEVQAVVLFNFIRFTEWPAGTLEGDAPFVIGVAGNRALEDELVALSDKQTVLERRVRVVRVKTSRDLAGCHVLYINAVSSPGEEAGPAFGELMPQARGKPILTVSSDAGFVKQGGIVNIYKAETGKLRFEIAPDNAKAAGLVLSSRLLSLARVVPGADSDKTP